MNFCSKCGKPMEERLHTPKSQEAFKDDLFVMGIDGAELLLLTCPCGHREVMIAPQPDDED